MSAAALPESMDVEVREADIVPDCVKVPFCNLSYLQ